jgi:hypothetical protein
MYVPLVTKFLYKNRSGRLRMRGWGAALYNSIILNVLYYDDYTIHIQYSRSVLSLTFVVLSKELDFCFSK